MIHMAITDFIGDTIIWDQKIIKKLVWLQSKQLQKISQRALIFTHTKQSSEPDSHDWVKYNISSLANLNIWMYFVHVFNTVL